MGLENIDEQFHFPSPHVLTVLRRWPVPAIFLVSQGLTGRLHTKTADCPGSLSIAVAAKAMQAGGKSLFGGEAAVVPGNMQKPEGKWRLGGGTLAAIAYAKRTRRPVLTSAARYAPRSAFRWAARRCYPAVAARVRINAGRRFQTQSTGDWFCLPSSITIPAWQ